MRAMFRKREGVCLPMKRRPSENFVLIPSKLLFQKRFVLSSREYFCMKKFILVLSLLSLLLLKGFSQASILSQSARVSVITMGPSQDEVYTAFGHSGIRVYDSARHIDAFFN